MEKHSGCEIYKSGGDAREVLSLDTFALDLRAVELIEESTIENKELKHEIYDNARTTILEAITASGHLSEINYTDNLDTVNRQILNRLLLGWSDSVIEPEKRRRFAEIREELIVHEMCSKIENGELPDNYMLLTFSDFPDNMTDAQAMNIGYRPSNRKGMVRLHRFYRDTQGRLCRSLEQMSRGGANPDSTSKFMNNFGMTLNCMNPSESALLQPIVISQTEFPDGVVDVQRQLDAYGQTIYGEHEANATHVPYELVRQESRVRETQLDIHTKNLEEFENTLLVSGKVETEIKTLRNNKILETLRSICIHAPEYAVDCFGKDAAMFYEKASDQYAAGDISGLRETVTRASSYEQPVTFCGGSITAQSKAGQNTPGTFESLLKLTNEVKKMCCPFCKASVWGDPCARRIKCGDCKAEVKDGKIINKGNSKKKKLAKKLGKVATKPMTFIERLFSQDKK